MSDDKKKKDKQYVNPLFMDHPQQPTAVFRQNPLIDKMKSDTEWTVSNNNKAPLDAKKLLYENYKMEYASLFEEPYPLVALTELDADPNLDYVNRAYHLDARKNRIFMIDVEPEATNDTLMNAMMCPAGYTEVSKRGGIHLLIEIPEDLITPENEYLLDTTVIKDEKLEIEYIFNNHYCTFTKKIVLAKPSTDFATNEVAKEVLKNILDTIVIIDKDNKIAREEAKKIKTNFNTDHLNMKAINKLISIKSLNQFISQQQKKSSADYNNNESSYERAVAVACVYKIKSTVKFAKESPYLTKMFESFDDNDAIYAAYELSKKIIPYREKHDTMRNGLPWLLYQAQGSWAYVIAQEALKEKEKVGQK